MLNKMDKMDILVSLILSQTHLCLFNFHRKWVQAIGLFAQATCAPEFGLPRPFNQRLLVLRVGGAAVKQQIKFKTNKFQNKNKNKNKSSKKGGI